MAEISTKVAGRRQGRSPSYPSVPLAEALEKAKAQYEAEGKYPAPLPSAFKSWGYSLKSSGGRELRASLRYFGLITIEGEGELAKVRLTEDAIRILVDRREDQTERNSIIRRLALNPSAHKKLWTRFPEGIRSEASATHFLVVEEGYNEGAAHALVKEFQETADFANLYGSPGMEETSSNLLEQVDVEPKIRVGDWVQVELNGLLQPGRFRVRSLAEHDGTTWVFVDGSDSAVPIGNVILERKADVDRGDRPSESSAAQSGVQAAPPASSTAQPPEREWLKGELARGVSYRLIVNGDVGPREIGKLITLLRAQQAVLSDDDE